MKIGCIALSIRLTDDLLALSDGLTAHGVTQVAIESTEEYWKPGFNLLESDFPIVLVNLTI